MKISNNVNKIEIFSSIALPTTSKSILVTGEWREGRKVNNSV